MQSYCQVKSWENLKIVKIVLSDDVGVGFAAVTYGFACGYRYCITLHYSALILGGIYILCEEKISIFNQIIRVYVI